MANPIVTSLPAYVEQDRLPLIAKTVLGSKSAGLFNLQTGLKGDTAINLINTDAVLQDGSSCGWNDSGSTTLTQRIIKPAVLKVNQSFCDKVLLKTWANYQVRIASGDKTLPFEEDFTNGIVNSVKEQVEKMIYQGASGKTDQFEGLISILSGATGDTGAIKVDEAKGTTAYQVVKDVYAKMPEAILEKEDAVILVGAGMFREFIQDLVSANLYHFSPTDKDGEYLLPGTNLRVISVNGLNGTNVAIGARLSNLFYGVDLADDDEKFDLWYSKDFDEFRVNISFLAGVNVAYPNEVVWAKVAEA